jgi:hypothetical protein
MKMRLTESIFSSTGSPGEILDVLAIYERGNDETLYLSELSLGAMYHHHDSKAYQITSPKYDKAKHTAGKYGWIGATQCQIIKEASNNQQAVQFLKRSEV